MQSARSCCKPCTNVSDSYHAIDDFRLKLLGLLPVATGAGAFLLLSNNATAIGTKGSKMSGAMAAICVSGFLFTLGLFSFELWGIKKWHYLIEARRRFERELGIRGTVLLTSRAHRWLRQRAICVRRHLRREHGNLDLPRSCLRIGSAGGGALSGDSPCQLWSDHPRGSQDP